MTNAREPGWYWVTWREGEGQVPWYWPAGVAPIWLIPGVRSTHFDPVHAGDRIPDPPEPKKPRKGVAYVNVYEDGKSLIGLGAYFSRANADACAGDSRVACVRVEIEEGRFDA